MGLYNFQARFVPFIEAGDKRHTIRAQRKYPDERGSTLYLYTGLRCLMVTRCTRVERIEITAKTSHMVSVDGVPLSNTEREELAKNDGFANWDEMLAFWEDRLPFSGDIIHWKYPGEARSGMRVGK